MDDLAIRFAGDLVQFLADAVAAGGDAILVDETRLAQFLHHDRHAARFIKILGDVIATRLEVHEIGGVAEDFADIVQIEVDAGLVGDGGQVQPRVGRAAGAGHDAGGVLQRLERDHVTGADVLFDQVHDRTSRRLAILVAAFVRRGHAR